MKQACTHTHTHINNLVKIWTLQNNDLILSADLDFMFLKSLGYVP